MRLSILHLSDVHIEAQTDAVLSRAAPLVAAISEKVRTTDGVLVVMTGDLANKGRAHQYQSASTFFAQIVNGLEKECPGLPIGLCVLPGNHDCDFDLEKSTRRTIMANSPLASLASSDADTIELLAQVQAPFREFKTNLSNQGSCLVSNPCLSVESFTFGTSKVTVAAINSAWMSRPKEEQGRLVVPTQAMPALDSADLIIVALHHTFNWLEDSNSRTLQKYVEAQAGLVLTGHEHESGAFERRAPGSLLTKFVEGGVLQDRSDPHRSSFNLIQVDTEEQRWTAAEILWRSGEKLFVPQRPFFLDEPMQGPKVKGDRFTVVQSFSNYLNDPGVPYTHPHAKTVTLRDIFVYPDLDDRAFEQQSKGQKLKTIKGIELAKHALSHKKLLIVGEELSGRTTLAKVLFQDLLNLDRVPLLLSGDQIKGHRDIDIERALERAIEAAYGPDMLDRFWQHPMDQRTIIVDDLDKISGATAKGRERVVLTLASRFGSLVLFAGPLIFLEDAIDSAAGGAFSGGRHLSIRELGFAGRGDLVERWCRLGSAEYVIEEHEIDAKVHELEDAVGRLLGTNLLPVHPFFVLAILQNIEASQHLKMAAGAHGYIYEALITAALSNLGGPETLDTRYVVLSMLADEMHRTGDRILSIVRVGQITDRYFEQYKVRIEDVGAFVKALARAKVLEARDGGVTFRYPYLYYYFIAKYLQEQMRVGQIGPGPSARVVEMCGAVHNELNANVIMFYIYLTKDPVVMNQVLSNAKSMFSDRPQATLGEPLAELAEGGETPTIVLPASAGRVQREQDRRSRDAVTREIEASRVSAGSAVSDEGMKKILTLNVALKTLDLLGQIVRNFPGSLLGEVKREITEECYGLGLRVLDYILSTLRDANTSIQEAAIERLTGAGTSKEEAERRARGFVMWMRLALALSMVKRVASAVGTRHLAATFAEVAEKSTAPAVRVIDAAIKLDNTRPLPSAEITRAYDEIHDTFGATVLRALVVEHLRLYKTKIQERQHLCSRMGIEQEAGRKQKLLPSPKKNKG